MLSIQDSPEYAITLTTSGSYGNWNDISSNHSRQRRDSTHSVAQTPTWPDRLVIRDDSAPLTTSDADNDGDGSDAEQLSRCPSIGWSVSVRQSPSPFSESSFVSSTTSPAMFESPPANGHNTNAPPNGDFTIHYLTPKAEKLDDEKRLHDIKTSDVQNCGNAAVTPVSAPRKRGRPRKYQHADPAPPKAIKGRSKTGCATCRRRKKKCDETKPTCLNCQKNSVVCEGYLPKEIWKSGKQKLEDAARTRLLTLARRLPELTDGVETELDRRLLHHFVFGFSRILTLINDDSNPFKEILLPMAIQHRGLMHSLLCLSGSHLSGLDPESKIKERKYHHFHCAIKSLKKSIDLTLQGSEKGSQLLAEDPIIASTIALSLNTICEGETQGEYRPHMDAARVMLVNRQPKNERFRQFIVEFFQYHDVSNSLTSLDRRPVHLGGDLRLPDFVPHAQAGALLGVFDGLFSYISEVTRLRDQIRQRFNSGHEPIVDYQILSEAVTIDSAIRSWEPSYEPSTPNWFLAQLYRQSTWVYLYRTIRPSVPSDKITGVVDDGLAYLDQLPTDAGANSIVLMPLFLMGCSAFLPHQRVRIKQRFESLQAYSNLRNIKPAFRVVERVWEVMDTNIEDSWDWEEIIRQMDMDFLIT